MTRERDSQRARFYKAVKVLTAFGTPLYEMREVETFLKKVRSRATLKRRYPCLDRDYALRSSGSRATTIPSERWMAFPVGHRDTATVLRIFAYLVTYRTDRKAAWHGWQYCSTLLDLVRWGISAEAAEALKESFSAHKVRWSKPIVKTLTEAQKAANVKRGKKLQWQMKDRKNRERFRELYPEAILKTPDEFEDNHWEVLYICWRP